MYKKCENCYKDGKVPDAESCKKCEDDLEAKAQELQQATDELQRAMDNYVQLDLQRVKEYNELVDLYKAKEQECEKLKLLNAMLNSALGYRRAGKKTFLELSVELYQLKTENEKMSKGYAELTEIVRPYIDDFTGYNEKLGGFDVVLCVKELLQQLKAK